MILPTPLDGSASLTLALRLAASESRLRTSGRDPAALVLHTSWALCPPYYLTLTLTLRGGARRGSRADSTVVYIVV